MARMTPAEWKKKKEEEKGQSISTAPTPSTTSNTTSNGGASGRMTPSEWKAKKAGTSLDWWAKYSISLLNEMQDKSKSWSYKDAHKDYSTKVSDLLSQASNWRNQYAGNEEAISYINSVVSALSDTKQRTSNIADIYSHYNSQEEYEWRLLQTGEDGESRKQRQDWWKDTDSRVKSLEGILGEYNQLIQNNGNLDASRYAEAGGRYFPGHNSRSTAGYTGANNTSSNQAAEFLKKNGFSSIKELEDELDKLKAQRTQYERGEGGFATTKALDDYHLGYMGDEAFLDASTHRDYGNASAEDLMRYQTLNDMETWTLMDDGRYLASDGRVIAEKNGNYYHPATDMTTVNDKLGLYLNATEEEKQMALGTAMGTWRDVYVEGSTKHWDMLTEDELTIYYGLRKTQGEKAADKFLEDIQLTLDQRATYAYNERDAKLYEDANALEKILLNIATVPKQLESNVFGFVEDAIALAKGEDINPYSAAHGGMHYTQTVRGETAKDLDATGFKIPVVNFTLGDLYQSGMSMVDSLAAMGVAGPYGSVLLGMGAAENEAYRLYQQGASTEQIAFGAATAGAAEMIFEKISLGELDKIKNIKSPKTLGQFFKVLLVQGGVEASEEMLTEIANTVSNAFIMGSQSDWEQLMRDNGGDLAKALGQKTLDVIHAGIGGFFSGAGSASLVGTASYASNLSSFAKTGGKIVDAGGVDSLKALAMEVSGGKGTIARQANAVKTDSDSLGNRIKAGRLYQNVAENTSDMNRSDIEASLVENGIAKKDAKPIAEAMVAKISGMELTTEQSKLLENLKDNAAVKAVEESIVANKDSDVSKRRQQMREFSTDVAIGMMKNEFVKQSTEKEFTPEGVYKATDNGKAIRTDTNEEIDIKGVSAISKGKLVLELSDGSTIDAKSVSFGREADALIYEAVAKLGDNISAESANQLIKQFKGGDAMVFARGIAQAYTYGFYGIDSSEMFSKHSLADKLTEAQRNFAYNLGKQYRPVKDQADKAKARITKAPAEKGVYYRDKDGNATDISTYLKESNIKLNDRQKTGIEAMRKMSEMIGVRFNVFESWVENGKRYYLDEDGVKQDGDPNGFYDTRTGEIYIDLNAGNSYQGTMLFTIAHEVTHFMRQWSPEHFRKIAEIVFQHGGMKGNVSELVALKQARAKAKGKHLSYDTALEELVADGMETILKDGKVIGFMADVKKKDHAAWEKLKGWFKNLAKFLRKMVWAYSDQSAQTTEGAKVAEFSKDLLNQIEQVYAEGAVEGGSYYQEVVDGYKAEQEKFSTANMQGAADGAVAQSEATTEITSKEQPRTEYEAFPKQVMSLSDGAGTILHSIEGLTPTKLKGLSGKTINGYTGRDVRAWAMKIAGFNEAQIQEVNKFMDSMADFMEEAGLTYKFIGLQDVKDAKLHYTYNSDGSIKSIVLSAMVKNGDYPVNFDLSSICKKREAMSKLMDNLAKRGSIDNGTVKLTPANIFKINTALKDAGYETACLGCFVESKRYNSLEWAKKFCNKWNAAVKKVNPNATYFGYGNATFNEDSFTLEQAIKIEDAANKYITTTKTERLANALKKYQAKAEAGLPLVESFSKAARDRLIKSDTISDELKDKYLNSDVTTWNMADVEFLLENGVLPGASLSNKQAVTEMVKSGEAYQHLLRPSDLLTDRGISKLEALPNFHGVLYGHYGSGTPKLMQSYTPYNSEIALLPANKNKDQSLEEYLYSIAGVRMQSFSDFQIQNIYDYLQMVADLAARKLPAHAYTKEISFAKLLGMTGIKTNLSVMFDIDPMADKAHAGLTKLNKLVHRGEYAKVVLEDEQGKWVYNIGDYQTQKLFAEAFPDEEKRFLQSIGFADAVKLQTTPGYSANCGIIGVGYSDLGIFAMLNDNRIRYIIPYHASSLPAEIKVATNIALGTDYTPYQNNMKISEITDRNGNKVNWSVKEAYKRLKSGQAVIDELNEKIRAEGWVVKTSKAQTGHGSYGLYENLQETNDPRQTAGNYMDWCIGNGTLPVFYQFASHENYYKLIYDYNVYDCVTEEYAPQQAVTNTYPTMVDGQVQPGNVTEGGFNTDYLKETADRQMAFMNAYNENRDADLEKLAENMEEGNYTLFSNRDTVKFDDRESAAGIEYNPTLKDWEVETALFDALDHADSRYDNLIRVGEMPNYITQLTGLTGEFFIYRNHAYENMVSEERAKQDGRPVIRKRRKIDFHDLGIETMTQAIMSLESPSVAIIAKNPDGNPTISMVLPIMGKNEAPLYGVLSFYANRDINGSFVKKPHVLLTISDRPMLPEKGSGRLSTIEEIENAVDNGNVLDYNKKIRANLPVIAQHTRLGNVTVSALKANIARFQKEVKEFREKNRINYSDRDNAPTFYSQMAKVVDGVKQEKLGAASVVSMLRGKGVKAEEIKWSGIEEWLEGKKSVTKAELQEFIAGSMLQIEEEVLTNEEIPYTEDQQRRLDEYTAKRDEIGQRLADEWTKITGDEFPIQNVGFDIESTVVRKIIEANSEYKDATFEGRLLKKLRNDLKEVIANNDDFGFDNWMDALRSIYRHRRDFISHYEMSTNDKAIIVKFCNALNAYNELPNKISEADSDRLRDIAKEVEVFNRKIGGVKDEHYAENAKRTAKWSQYKLKGGRNYKEILFKIPGSSYYNTAMAMHWDDRNGVLAHARIQDLDTFLGKMLFIEELQSDWHNDGHKDGYAGDEPAVRKKVADLQKEWNSLYNELQNVSGQRAAEINEKLDSIDEERHRLRDKLTYGQLAPDAPFKNNYHEYVLKRLLRMAAEEGYDSIGWTTADIQSERWSDDYAEGYRIEYDQDIPKFMKKYGKQWGTRVGKTTLDNGTEVWSMAITDSMKESVLTEGQALYSDRAAQTTFDDAVKAIHENHGSENEDVLTEMATDVMNTLKFSDRDDDRRDETYSLIGRELLAYEEGDMAPDLTLVETFNERTGKTETTIKHFGQKPKDYIPKRIAYCYKLFEQHPDGSLHALFAGAKSATPIGVWQYAQGFPYTDAGVKGMGLRERYGWHLSAGLPSAPHLMSPSGFERGYPSKNSYGHPKGSKRVWVRMAYDASTDFNGIADSTKAGDIFGLIPFGGYYAFKENNQSEWVISSAVKIDKILKEDERQQILREAGYDEYEAWRKKYRATEEEKAESKRKSAENKKAKDNAKKAGLNYLSESAKEMREAIKSRIIDNPELSNGKALYQDRTEDSVSNRSLLANAFEGMAQNDIERNKIQEYKSKISLINAEEQKLRELNAQIKELSFAKGPKDTKKLKELRFDANQAANRINTYDKQLLRLEASQPLQDVLAREKKRAYSKAAQRGREALAEYKAKVEAKQKETTEKWRESRKAAVAKARETAEKRDAREKLQKLVLDTVKWITYPAKTDVKCPDILKQPYADFLNGIDLSSKRLANGGDPTKNDLRLSSAMDSLATALDRIMTAQDPTQETDKVLDTGYLDLPANFVKQLRDMNEDIKKMMVDGDYVVNTMTASEVRKLSQMIRTLNHAIKTMSNLYANLRFANVEALGFDTMEFMDALGEIEKTGGMKDFVEWDNALPYYAFKRFGKGGESVFEGLMDAQDKLAFLAQVIFDFQEKTWTGAEAKAWSEDTHTITLPNGNELTLTTADAMSIYCLSRREQGLQHLLGGGTRVIGLQKGSTKAKDSRSLLTIKDIDAINSSLTDRQKQVAEGMQEFMSTVCSEWGNEISMKRFLTKEFTEKFYFPIESNDENLTVKDPAAQQSDLFRLLNISATKPLTPGANNEVIIRNIFDVFTGHASDMARLNAFGMGLLDYMKWLNYREKTVSDEGQVNVKGVRKSMEKAYGKAANSYVLNLVKDVNGRASDGGDPTILMRWMRAGKTASVGSSLRVATLQITSYPRAALVLSPKSLALGLSKLPNINKAKKYCGIALWKSFGFYDTNISRSIEDQMKGVKDVKQKLIELSLKGAELGDAITWGALWNACEYEVAATKEFKVGTEEFYQAVGKKLREVVYRTQVVDSTLTRSQMMRSKRGMAQEASAFMSEPTLSANILMDAGFEFNAEKRRTGSAKAAWKKTGTYIGRAVAVYSIGQLAAALLEGLWDAWRDDEDEEFGEKFLSAFVENLALDLVPFNKIPIVSDVFEAALAMFGVGFYSSDKMSTTWLTQAVSAVDAWKDVLSGNSSTTAYNALYKTVRAVSSFVGVSISGVMREGVALWNNTAGAYDATLKVLTYDRSKAELGGLLLDAIIDGDDRQADSLRGEFADEEAYQSALRTAIKDRFEAGEIDYDTAMQYLVDYGGVDEDKAYWKIEEWEYEAETGEDFGKYDDFFVAVETGKNLNAVIKKYTDNGVTTKTLASQISTHFKSSYMGMTKSERANIKGYLLNAYTALGYDREDAMETIGEWEYQADYPDLVGRITYSQYKRWQTDGKPNGVSIELFTKVAEYRDNGTSESAKSQDEVAAYINSLPISTTQKDALWCCFWKESTLKNAPWH